MNGTRQRRGPCHGLAPLLVAGLGAVCLAAPAGATPRCPIPGKTPQVSLTTDTGKVTWRAGHTRGDLRRMARRLTTAGAGDHPLGLTVAEFRLDLRTSVSVMALGANRYCAVPAQVSASIGYPAFAVYVDRRYWPGTCEYSQISRHEKQHIAAYRRELAEHAPEVRQRLRDAARRMKPVFVGRPQAAADLIQARIRRRIDPVVRRLQKSAEAANARLDTARNYGRVQARCGDW